MKKDEPKSKIGLIILAAGSSSRLGTPKQLISFRGETLLQRIVRESLKSSCHLVLIVSGKNADEISKTLEDIDVQVVENQNWEQGMGTSISVGIRKITEIEKHLAGVIICVCDQPFVTAEIINNLINAFYDRKCRIVASVYGDTFGVPTLFGKSLFGKLADLEGKIGAKHLIDKFRNKTVFVEFERGAVDIDTAADLKKLEKYR